MNSYYFSRGINLKNIIMSNIQLNFFLINLTIFSDVGLDQGPKCGFNMILHTIYWINQESVYLKRYEAYVRGKLFLEKRYFQYLMEHIRF